MAHNFPDGKGDKISTPISYNLNEHDPHSTSFKGYPSEKDPLGKSSKEPGAKLDAGKTPIYQGLLDYFPRALAAVADLSAYGANKYAWKGWESVPDGYNRYSNALGRHIIKKSKEGPLDQEILKDPLYPAMVLHDTSVAWNALARLELYLRGESGEDALHTSDTLLEALRETASPSVRIDIEYATNWGAAIPFNKNDEGGGP